MIVLNAYLFSSGGGGPVVTPYPLKANVKFYTYGKGADATTAFADHSPSYREITTIGAAQVDTALPLDGPNILCTTGGTGYLQVASSTDFDVGNATDFCVEGKVRLDSLVSSTAHIILSTRPGSAGSSGNGGFWLYVDGTSGNLVFQTITSAGAVAGGVISSVSLSVGSDYHVAGTRQGSTLRVFVNGVLVGTATQSGTASDPSGVKSIGSELRGALNDVRFTNGEPVYTQTFVSPIGGRLQHTLGAFTDVTLNPNDKDSNVALTRGHLRAAKSIGDALRSVRATRGFDIVTDFVYWEVDVIEAGAASPFALIGISPSSMATTNYAGQTSTSYGYYQDDGGKYNNATSAAMGASWKTNGDRLMVAAGGGKLWFGKNNTFNGNPAAGAGAAFTGLTGTFYPTLSPYRASSVAQQFRLVGDVSQCSYTAPSGFSYLDPAL